MIVKLIEVQVKPGHLAEYLAAQEIWNRETRLAPGFLGLFCGQSAKQENVVHLFFYWRSLADYEEWMANDHDRIAGLANAEAHYERINVRMLEPTSPPTPILPSGFLPEETLEAADVQLWSEAYRATVVIRAAVRLRLFSRLADAPRQVTELAAELRADAHVLERLLQALSAMELVSQEQGAWRNTELASRTLVEDAPAYQGNMILHNSRPATVQHWMKLCEELGLPPDTTEAQTISDHEQFIRAMSNTAQAGQAAALLEAVDLSEHQHLLDIGGGAGAYAIALCRAYPRLRATIIDLPETEPLASAEIRRANLEERVNFLAHDYRQGAFPAPVDVMLLSNVLRGESPLMVFDMLRRAYEALEANGLVIVHDLFPETPPAPTGLRAALFGLHLLSGANMSLSEMAQTITHAGFALEREQRLSRSVVMNGVIIGRRA
jgi:heme-degrading monooxygenase HmoA/methylase of polypeptide subunit release factors